jgi:hypothetical protein
MDLTMLRQMSHHGCVDAMLEDALGQPADTTGKSAGVTAVGETATRNLAQILWPQKVSAQGTPIPLTHSDAAAALKSAL